MASQVRQTPKDALVIMAILKDMGVTEYEPRVINQLLEFMFRYVTNILDDARVYANHAKKKNIDGDDVKLAVQMQMDRSFTTPPPRDILLEVARSKNCIPLPLIKPHCGIHLPPDRYCLSACNYRMRSTKKPSHSSSTPSTPSSSLPKMTLGGSRMGGMAKAIPKGGAGGGPKMMPKVVVGGVGPKPVIKVTPGTMPMASSSKQAKHAMGMAAVSTTLSQPTVVTTMAALTQPSIVKMELDSGQEQGIKRKRPDDEYSSM